PELRVTQPAGGDVLDADAGSIGMGDLGAEAEGGAAAGDTKGLGLAGVELGAEGDVDVEIVIAVADVESGSLGGSAVDLDGGVFAVGLAAGATGDGEGPADGLDA